MPIPRLSAAALALLFFASPARASSPRTEEGVKLFEAGRQTDARAALEAAAREDPKDARAAL
ncbi:MAG: hypothetical protein ACRD00_03660, partial [Thermoanaerobaculia bacterium]